MEKSPTDCARVLDLRRATSSKATGVQFQKAEGVLGKSRILVVANRLPVTIRKSEDGSFHSTLSSGGLVSALKGVTGLDMVWIGWPGSEIDADDQPVLEKALSEQNCVPVFLPSDVADKYYNGFSNNLIWPLFHYRPLPLSDLAETTHLFNAYKQANHAFKETVASIYQPGDVVWVHDYHLMLLPEMLREQFAHMKIGYFLHIPFPSSEVYRIIPQRTQLLQGLLSADLIGFHTYDYVRHFKGAVSRLMGYETTADSIIHQGTSSSVGTFPIGIEPKKFLDALETTQVKDFAEGLKARFKDKRVIVGVDRLDTIKGIPNKLLAMEKFLVENPHMASEVVLVQYVVPSRLDVPMYQELSRELHELVGRINGKHGSLFSSPICLFDQSLAFPEMVALFSVADVALITSLRDGMNLVSYEYVACQKDRHGVLILSEFAGSAQCLGAGALLINPWDIDETAAAIADALVMNSSQRAALHKHAFRYVLQHTAQLWAENFVSQLSMQRVQNEQMEERVPPRLNKDTLCKSLSSCKRRLVVLGLFGTLTERRPLDKFKQSEVLPQHVVSVLTRILADPNTTVLIATSSARPQLEAFYSALNRRLPLWLAAENGVFLRHCTADDAKDGWMATADYINVDFLDVVRPIFAYFAERTPGSYVEERDTSIVWNFLYANTDFGPIQALECRQHLLSALSTYYVDILFGTKSLEVRPQVVSRGIVANRVLEEMYRDSEPPDFMLSIRNSTTRDEGLFAPTFVNDTSSASETHSAEHVDITDPDKEPIVPFYIEPQNMFTVTVGKFSSSSRFFVENSNQVFALLNSVADVLSGSETE